VGQAGGGRGSVATPVAAAASTLRRGIVSVSAALQSEFRRKRGRTFFLMAYELDDPLAALMSSSARHSENHSMRRSRALPVCQWEHDQQDAMRMLVKQSSSSGRSIPRTSPTPEAGRLGIGRE
jgi:hypothetical protein